MRGTLWLGLAAGTLTLAGCESLRDAFSPQANLVATAAGQRLTADELAATLGRVPATPSEDIADLLANFWVDLHLLGEATVQGTLGRDSATVARVMWPQLLQARMQEWQDSLASRRPRPTEASVDSAYAEGTVRLFQHILVVPTGTTAADTASARVRIASLLNQVRRGADFGTLAGQNADASRENRGLLGREPSPRGQFVPEFEDAAWALDPGGVSGVVQTQFGFHLIRRAPLAEVREQFRSYVERATVQRFDSAYVTELARAHELAVAENAATLMKEAAADLEGHRRSGRRLVSYRGGPLTVAGFVRWMEALQPGQHRQILNAPDSVLRNFAEAIAQNELVIRQMDSAGIRVPDATWQAAQLAYRSLLEQLAAEVGLSDSVVADTTLPASARRDSAASRVERYFDRVVAGEAQYRPIPLAFSSWLREHGRYRLTRAGVVRAVELATRARESAAPPPPPPVSPIQPAPGGPPVPAPDTTKR
jgi:hypothetical protein